MLEFSRAWGRAAVSAAALLTVGVAKPRLRSYLRRFADEVGVFRRTGGPFPVRPLAAVGSGDVGLLLPDPDAAEGNVTLTELVALARLVRARHPRVVWEIGTFDGRTTRMLAANAGPAAAVHTLDLPADGATAFALAGPERTFVEKPQSGARFVGTAEAARITQHVGDSAAFDFSAWYGVTDFVFVDGSHAASYVASDTARAISLTAGRPATIVWHDYGEWPGVAAFLDATADRFPGAYRVAGTTLVVWERSA